MNFPFLLIVSILALISLIFHAGYVYGKLGIKDIPNQRSLHSEITKKSGGMVFIPLFLVFVLIGMFLNPQAFANPEHIKLLLLGTIFFCFLGLVDDLYQLSPNLRLFLEFSFSFAWVYFLNPTISLFGFTITEPMSSMIVTGFIIVFIVNLVNFMDGLDLYLIGTLFVSILFWIPIYSPVFLPSGGYFVLLTLLLAAISGFAFFNFPKAKLFMGDSGSLAIGFLLIILPLLALKEEKESLELLSLFFLFPIFWIDGIITIIIRSWQKKHIFSAHREHLYQLLTETKIGKTGTCIVMVFANLPAIFLYASFKLKQIKWNISDDNFILIIILLYLLIYSLIRFAIFKGRKNLA